MIYLNTFSRNKKIIIIILGILVFVLIGIVLFFYLPKQKIFRDKDVIAIVGEKKIYQKDLNVATYSMGFVGSIENPAPVSDQMKKQILDELIEREIVELKAKEVGVSVVESDVIAKAKLNNTQYDSFEETQKELIRKIARAQILKERVKDKILAWSEGKFIIARFDVHYYDLPSVLSEDQRKVLIPQEKEYAKKLIDQIYENINSGKITFEQGMEIINSDPKIGTSAWDEWTMTLSKSFTKEDSIARNYPNGYPDFWNEIANAPVEQITKPISLKTVVDEECAVASEGEQVDGMYIIIKKEKGSKGEATSYEEWIKNQKNKLDVQTYI